MVYTISTYKKSFPSSPRSSFGTSTKKSRSEFLRTAFILSLISYLLSLISYLLSLISYLLSLISYLLSLISIFSPSPSQTPLPNMGNTCYSYTCLCDYPATHFHLIKIYLQKNSPCQFPASPMDLTSAYLYLYS